MASISRVSSSDSLSSVLDRFASNCCSVVAPMMFDVKKGHEDTAAAGQSLRQ